MYNFTQRESHKIWLYVIQYAYTCQDGQLYQSTYLRIHYQQIEMYDQIQ